jgi:complement component 1 Q subcomponent-binding protein
MFVKFAAAVPRMCAVNKTALIAATRRSFASLELVTRSGAKLAKSLEKEIKYENDNYNQLEDIETFLRESGFTYTEQEHGVKMSLTKTVGDKKVEILFEARQPQADEEQPEEHQDANEQEQGMSENYCDFTIIVSDASGKSGMIVEATSMDTEVNYNSVMVTDDIAGQKSVHRFDRQMKAYVGPDFSTLDERIQTSLTEYLEGFGVNEHLCAFVECMSLDKDQRLYMEWLAKLKQFVEV